MNISTLIVLIVCFFFSSRRRHTIWNCDWSSDVCSSDLTPGVTGLNDTLVPSYLVQDGIRYVVTDTSVIGQANNGPNPSPNVGMVNGYAPSLYEVPRHPNDIFFNAVNWADTQAEFSCFYNNP